MLPAGARLKRSEDFRLAMRTGQRSGSRTVVVYLARTGDASCMAGLAVSKAVGNAVVRNRVARRLRAILADAIPTLPSGSRVVVRALPAAATADFATLREDLVSCLRRVVVKTELA